MALRAGYYGLKKKFIEKVIGLPAIKSIGSGLALNSSTGELSATGIDVSVVGNPEEAATAGDLTKLQIGSDIFNVPDTTYSNATTSEAGLMSAADKEKLDGLEDVTGNPSGTAAAGDLTKLQIGDDIFNVPDTTYSNATTTEAGLMSADDKTALNGLTTPESISVSEVTGLTAYELSDSATAVYRIGRMVFVRFNLKSLTVDNPPSGQSWIDVIEGLPRPLYNVNLTLVSGKTTGNDAQIFIPNVGANYNLQARGGSPNDVYFVSFSYIAAQP